MKVIPATSLALLLAVSCSEKAPPPPVVHVPVHVPAVKKQEGSVPAATVQPGPAPAAGIVPPYEKIEDRLPTAPANYSRIKPASIDRKMTEALHQYYEANGKLPPDFNALVTARNLKQVPAPPPGKKFAVDRPNMQVVAMDP